MVLINSLINTRGVIKKVELLAEEPDNSKTVKLHIKVPEEVISADYQFTIQAITKDQKIKKTLDIIIVVIEKKEGVQKGEYPLTFVVGSGENRKTIDLKAIVTGTYKLNLKTETRQLNVDNIAGKSKTLTIFIRVKTLN